MAGHRPQGGRLRVSEAQQLGGAVARQRVDLDVSHSSLSGVLRETDFRLVGSLVREEDAEETCVAGMRQRTPENMRKKSRFIGMADDGAARRVSVTGGDDDDRLPPHGC